MMPGQGEISSGFLPLGGCRASKLLKNYLTTIIFCVCDI